MRAVAERMPEGLWPAPPGEWLAAGEGAPPADERTRREMVRWRLMRRVRDTFDPMHILNPGILGAVIA
jgi:FAD/FMN-containing dehydrogenase